jgi:hypothetical protein
MPDLFPEGVPTFMGHYHKPHTVQGTSIQYVGSPFQGASLCPQSVSKETSVSPYSVSLVGLCSALHALP